MSQATNVDVVGPRTAEILATQRARPRFKARPGDVTWGKFDYPVTEDQKRTLDAIYSAFPVRFYSQNYTNGHVILGCGVPVPRREGQPGWDTSFEHTSVTVRRDGRVVQNSSTTAPNFARLSHDHR